MKFGIIAAMEQELRSLVAALENKSQEVVLEHTYYSGNLGQHELVLVQSGVGKVMSAMSVAILADHFQVDALINTGSAGAVAPDIAIGDVVIADRLAYHDVDLTAFGYDYGQMSMQPLYFVSDPNLVAGFKSMLEKHHLTSHLGLITTSDSFIADQGKINQIKKYFPDALAVEMEGAAVAQAAKAADKPFIVIRAMSDTAEQDANLTFEEFIIEAGKRSAQVLIDFMERYKGAV